MGQRLINSQLLDCFTAGLGIFTQLIATLGGGIRSAMLTKDRVGITSSTPNLDFINPPLETTGNGRTASHATADGDFRNGIAGNIGYRQ